MRVIERRAARESERTHVKGLPQRRYLYMIPYDVRF